MHRLLLLQFPCVVTREGMSLLLALLGSGWLQMVARDDLCEMSVNEALLAVAVHLRRPIVSQPFLRLWS